MAEAAIPVDLLNPGQVFACLGFMEAADVLIDNAAGGFDWSDTGNARFYLSAQGEENPFEAVLAFLAETDIKRFGPIGYADPPPKKGKKGADEEDAEASEDDEEESETGASLSTIELTQTFPTKEGNQMTLPVRLGGGNRPIIELGHWADEWTGRQSFKLYSGNRSADKIARAMLKGVRRKPSKIQKQIDQAGDFKTQGIVQLWEEKREQLIKEPFNVLTPMGGSFNFDPRGAWTAVDAGYSPNDQGDQVAASPVVEFLAAWGLEYARPIVSGDRQVRYAIWGVPLPPCLARVALIGAIPSLPMLRFRFQLDSSGKNKIATFAEREI